MEQFPSPENQKEQQYFIQVDKSTGEPEILPLDKIEKEEGETRDVIEIAKEKLSTREDQSLFGPYVSEETARRELQDFGMDVIRREMDDQQQEQQERRAA